jgi:hypothetical protein
MALNEQYLPRCLTGEAFTVPQPDNENLLLLDGCVWTPAEVMQWVRQEKRRLSRKLAANPRLWTCPEHRRTWNATIGIEKLTLWQCYGVLDVS